MVENQHGLGSVLSFSAKSVNPEILEALLVGREKIVNQLENRVKNISNDGLNHQVLLIGARGTGKTHMLSVLHNRIQPQIEKGKIKVAYFAEEEYGISDYLDFMVRILNAFIRWNEEDAEFLKSQLSVLQETPNSQQEDTIERIIRDYISGKPLLVLAENFNDILSAIKKDGQSKLRNWLQENNRISIIATSQALSDDIGKEDKPFYGFFDEINIKSLTLEQSFKLLKSLAELEKREDVIEHLENKGKSQVMAINTLVKGNHRLLITFYEFLKSDVLSNLSVMFIKTLNDLKPYYETFIRYQQPQQQKIIRFLALSKTPRQGTEIARECFIDQKSLSKQMSELARKKLVDVITDPDDKRNKLYDISEPLLRISIEIGEHKEGISALFIDFLAIYYNENELNSQKARFSKFYEKCQDLREKQQLSYEISAREKALQIQSELINVEDSELTAIYYSIIEHLNNREYDDALSVIERVKDVNKDELYYYALASIYLGKDELFLAKDFASKAIQLNNKSCSYHNLLGNIFYDLKDYKGALKSFKKATEIDEIDEEALYGISMVYSKTEKIKEQINILKKVIQNNSKAERAYYDIGVAFFDRKEYRKAISYLEKSKKLNPDSSSTLNTLGMCYGYLKEIDKAVKIFKESFNVDPSNIITNLILGSTLLKFGKTKKAIPFFDKIIELKDSNSEIGVNSISLIINSILKYDEQISIEKCLLLEDFLEKKKLNKMNELKISLILIKTFRKMVLENNQKALYDLPKEQREFFQKEILDFRKTHNHQNNHDGSN